MISGWKRMSDRTLVGANEMASDCDRMGRGT